ncbi:hypothetical protein BACCAP_00975 [Pseudoflavonifractor capillosus ATCC 29799]|uniref:Uncharacterized protein n=1 Tax=Pseudoflavonifractor capillosus ATCC 29799 TaxID=411467 RepID=A6NRZ6_9FIRM|nr:hypothetical protein BACCAP_00975 [Pseudoflavonifractor capillosus ATCC 29799]
MPTHRSRPTDSFVCSCLYYTTFFNWRLLCGVALNDFSKT